MTTFILSCVNAGFFGGTQATPLVFGLAIFCGGVVQLLAGMRAFRRGRDVRRRRVLLVWLIFTFCTTIAALRTNAAVLWVFITLTATYLLLPLAVELTRPGNQARAPPSRPSGRPGHPARARSPRVRPVRGAVHPAARARPVVLGRLPGGMESRARRRGRHARRRD